MKLISKYFVVVIFIITHLSSLFLDSFHHHKTEEHHNHSDSFCEIDYNFSIHYKSCHHESHFEFEEDECFWCDDYNVPSYYFSRSNLNYNLTSVVYLTYRLENSYKFSSFDNLKNKSPPVLFS